MPARLTTREFILRARIKHGDKYIYDKSVFCGSKESILIVCKIHGEFYQKAESHMAGYGCDLCARDVRRAKLTSSTDVFIGKAIKIHGNRYDYTKCEYKGNHRKVTISCRDHGEFQQQPANHLAGNGCPLCKLDVLSKKFSDDRESFIAKAMLIHGKKFIYDKVEYVKSGVKVCITCPEHGDFYQVPNSHLSGSACSKCTAYGFKPASIYIAEMDGFCKIGISNNVKRRVKDVSKSAGKSLEVVAEYLFSSWSDARKAEAAVHKEINHLSAGMSGFDGATEFFLITPQNAAEIIIKHGGAPK